VSADVSDLVRGYLTRNGWEEAAPGPIGTMWRQGTTRIGVPQTIAPGSLEWCGVVARIASHEVRGTADVAADITGSPALTCECCRAAPATHLLVADFPKIKRAVKLACEPCGRRDIEYGKGQPPTQVRLYVITEVTDG
jgi:hypothetical protein